MWSLTEWCAAFIGAVLIFSATQKLTDWRGWISQSAQLGVPRSVATVVAPLEGLVGVALVSQLLSRLVLVVSLAMLLAFTTLIVSLLARGRRPACACFGAARSRPISWWTVVRNVVFITVNAIALLGTSS
jgi:hypothetical protein